MDSRLPMAFGNVEDPITLEERRAMANFTTRELGLTLPTVVDDMEDSVSLAYHGWPERLYLVGADGNVLYRGGPGPFGFDPDGLEASIREALED